MTIWSEAEDPARHDRTLKAERDLTIVDCTLETGPPEMLDRWGVIWGCRRAPGEPDAEFRERLLLQIYGSHRAFSFGGRREGKSLSVLAELLPAMPALKRGYQNVQYFGWPRALQSEAVDQLYRKHPDIAEVLKDATLYCNSKPISIVPNSLTFTEGHDEVVSQQLRAESDLMGGILIPPELEGVFDDWTRSYFRKSVTFKTLDPLPDEVLRGADYSEIYVDEQANFPDGAAAILSTARTSPHWAHDFHAPPITRDMLYGDAAAPCGSPILDYGYIQAEARTQITSVYKIPMHLLEDSHFNMEAEIKSDITRSLAASADREMHKLIYGDPDAPPESRPRGILDATTGAADLWGPPPITELTAQMLVDLQKQLQSDYSIGYDSLHDLTQAYGRPTIAGRRYEVIPNLGAEPTHEEKLDMQFNTFRLNITNPGKRQLADVPRDMCVRYAEVDGSDIVITYSQPSGSEATPRAAAFIVVDTKDTEGCTGGENLEDTNAPSGGHRGDACREEKGKDPVPQGHRIASADGILVFEAL